MMRSAVFALLFCSSAHAVEEVQADQDVLQGLAADDVCQAGDEQCALKLLQLRGEKASAEAKAQAEEVAQASVTFGEDAEGEDMWPEQDTWDSVLSMIQANRSSGICDSDTHGTCTIKSCARSRGGVECKNGKCLCAKGYCAQSGTCFPQTGVCVEDSGGSCGIFSCKKSRGETKCKSGKCLCTMGGCAWKGKCMPVTFTGGTCKLMGCASSRGITTCHKGKCLCKNGYVSIHGICVRQVSLI